MVTQLVGTTRSLPWMMCNGNGSYNFSNPQALVVYGPNLWVVNAGNNSLTEMNAASGMWPRDFT